MLSLRHCDNVFLFVFYQVKFHFRSLGAVLFLTSLMFVSPSPSFSSWNHFAVWMAWPHTTPLRNGCSLGKADQGKLCHRNLFRHPRPEPINTVLDTRFGEGPLIHVKHLTCVVTGPIFRIWGKTHVAPVPAGGRLCPWGKMAFRGHSKRGGSLRVTETHVVWRRSPLKTYLFTFLL